MLNETEMHFCRHILRFFSILPYFVSVIAGLVIYDFNAQIILIWFLMEKQLFFLFILMKIVIIVFDEDDLFLLVHKIIQLI